MDRELHQMARAAMPFAALLDLTVEEGSPVRWTAEPVHVGRSTIVVQTDARDEAGALISRSLQTQAVLHTAP